LSIKASTAAAILGSALVCAGACDSSRSASPSVSLTEKDSAGVRVVSHAQGPIGQIARREPALEIGREGDPSYEFFGTTDVVALGSGNIVVMNGGSDELRFYDPLGNHLRSVGRSGDGPAEFRFLSRLSMRPGDTLMAVDPQRRRLVYFDSAGTFVRGESYAADLTSDMPGAMCTFPGLVGVLGDGARVVRGWGCMAFAGSDGVRPTMTTITIAREELRDTVGSIRAYTVWERADLGTSYSITDDDGFGRQFTSYLTLGAGLPEASGQPGLFIRVPLERDARQVLDLSIGLSARF